MEKCPQSCGQGGGRRRHLARGRHSRLVCISEGREPALDYSRWMTNPWGGDQPRQLFTCRTCGTHNEGIVEGQYTRQMDEDEPQEQSRYRLVRCLNCGSPSVFRADLEQWWGTNQWDFGESRLLYPEPAKLLSAAIPEKLRANMQEAQRCLDAFAYTAAAMVVRRSLELLAGEYQIKERTLAKSIAKLRDEKHIDERLFFWADELRLAGNDAAHEIDQETDEQTARDMFQLVEAILDYVYVIQERYEEFKTRRLSPAAPSVPTENVFSLLDDESTT